MSDSKPTLKDFHHAFPQSALIGTDQDKYYVNRFDDDANNVVEQMKQLIEWDDEEGACYLFTGLRGSGKTTELNHLKNQLTESAISTFYIDASRYLALNTADLKQSLLIFAVLAGLNDAVKERFGDDLLKESPWERFTRLLNAKVDVKTKVEPLKGVGLEFTIHDHPSLKEQILEFAKKPQDFHSAAQGYVNDVKELIKRKTGTSQIVIIVDSLERLSAAQGHEGNLFNSLKEIFYDHPTRLYFRGATVIYTIPPYLHAVLPNVDAHYSKTFSLSNFKVIQSPKHQAQLAPNPDGLKRIQQAVEKRFPQWEEFLSSDVLQHFAWLSGGNVRRLYSLLRHFIMKAKLLNASLPVTSKNADAVQRAINEEVAPLRWLNKSDRKWLAYCHKHHGDLAKEIQDLEQDLPPIIRLFNHSLILDYRNGDTWYQILPLIENHIDIEVSNNNSK